MPNRISQRCPTMDDSFRRRSEARRAAPRSRCLALEALEPRALLAGGEVLFFDDFNGPTLNSAFQASLPTVAPLGDGSGPCTYLGASEYSFASVDSASVLRMTNTLNNWQRRGWSTTTTFAVPDFRYEARFNVLVQSPTTSIDSFLETWIIDAANPELYAFTGPHGGALGVARQFRSGGSIDGRYVSTSHNYADNTWYRLVIDAKAGQNIRTSLYADDGTTELISRTLSYSPSAFTNGFRIGLAQATGLPNGSYPLDVAIDWIEVTRNPADSAGVSMTTPQPVVTSEGGPATSFSVVLNTQPVADVTIPISSSNTSEAIALTTSLTFTMGNWYIPQAVNLRGVDDYSRDDDEPYTVALGPITSVDPDYSGLDPTDIAAVNLDSTLSGFLYWVDNGTDMVQRSTLEGANSQALVDLKTRFGGTDGNYAPRYVDIDPTAGKVYWTDSAAGRIQRSDLDGSNLETVISGFANAGLRGIAVDSIDRKIYWTDFAAQKIRRANLDGSGSEDLVTNALSGVRAITLDTVGGKMYWADVTENTIRRANLDGTGIEVLWAGVVADNPSGIALDTTAGKLYWTDSGNDKIVRANLDGSQIEELVDLKALFATAGDTLVASLAIDARAGKLYFSDLSNWAIYRANLDGSNPVPVVANHIYRVQGIAIATPSATVSPSTDLVTSETGGSTTFQVALNVPPKAIVSIPVSSSDTTEGTVAVSSLTFTPGNWNVPQTVTVTGVEDSFVDGHQTYSVVLGPATSTDANYAGMDPADVALLNRDNEVKFFVVDDATANKSFQYGLHGTAQGSTNLGSSNSAPRGIASSIAGDKTWVVDANRKVYVYRTADGNLLGSWTAGTLANNAQPEGIATNGSDVWIVDNRSDKVYRYAGAAQLLSGSQTASSSFNLASGNATPKDLVTDGQFFWVVDDTKTSDKVFKYNLGGGLLGSWTIDSTNKSPTGIAIDPVGVNHIWIVDSGTDRVYQYDAAASLTSGSRAASSSWGLAAGNGNPQGIADPPVPADQSAESDGPFRSVTNVGVVASYQAPNHFLSSENWRRHDVHEAEGVKKAMEPQRLPVRRMNRVLAREQFFASFSSDHQSASLKHRLRSTIIQDTLDEGLPIDCIAANEMPCRP